jgi:hypothetical protein
MLVTHARAFVTNAHGFLGHARAFVTNARSFLSHTRAFVTNPRRFLGHARAFVTYARHSLSHARAFLTHTLCYENDGRQLSDSYHISFVPSALREKTPLPQGFCLPLLWRGSGRGFYNSIFLNFGTRKCMITHARR